MADTTSSKPRRKALGDYLNSPRSPILSYLHKQRLRPPPVSGRSAWTQRFIGILEYSPSQLLAWIWQYLSHRIGPRHRFESYPISGADNGIYAIETDVRIALAGDWATGTAEAVAVAERISAFEAHYTIHLGDVYYVGDLEEVEENFLGIKNPASDYTPCLWPPGSKGSFALNGNHEMYALGYAYFNRMLPALGLNLGGKPERQKASFFCLENDYWRIIALDTGYNSIGWPLLEYIFPPNCALRPELINWLRDTVRLQDDDRRGLIILTHHEYYSAYDDWFPKPAQQLAKFISRPVLWFWGHEHRMAIYGEFATGGGITAFGRCIGHGGMPIELPNQAVHDQCSVKFVDNRIYENSENQQIGYNGFARMQLSANQLSVEYVDLNGTVIFMEAWRSDNGVLTRTK